MIDFPTPSTVGQVFDPGTGVVYQWDGVAWNVVAVPGNATARRNNRVVNGSIWISQENGTAAVTSNSYPADQWVLQSGLSAQAQDSGGGGALSPDGNTYQLLQWFTVAKGTLAAADYAVLIHPMDPLPIRGLNWGTPNAKPAVLRFNAFCGLPGTYTVGIRDGSNTYTYLAGVALTAGFQTFALAIPGPTSGTWTATLAAQIHFCSACGSTFIGVPGWQSGNKLAVATQTNLASVTSTSIAITDVGFYDDPGGTGVPPPWETPKYTDELAACQWYWQAPEVYFRWDDNLSTGVGLGHTCYLGVWMRTGPTFTMGSTATTGWTGISMGLSRQNVVGFVFNAGQTGIVARTLDFIAKLSARIM